MYMDVGLNPIPDCKFKGSVPEVPQLEVPVILCIGDIFLKSLRESTIGVSFVIQNTVNCHRPLHRRVN